ncbi:hypothetical protein CHISP_2328 [Chitinispirillum alkaliphilum]|nr:hypothetical protein CHISP_2328 [Chitinispirillum alkaliphilum]
MIRLKEILSEHSDEELAKQYLYHKDEYTPEALRIIEQEIESRELDIDKLREKLENSRDKGQKNIQGYRPEEFNQLQGAFSHTDILLVSAILREHKIPFYIDKPISGETIPLESEATKVFHVKIHNQHLDTAKELIEEHFMPEEGMYTLKHSDLKDRLKAFSFSDIHLDEKTAAEKLEVSFSAEEVRTIKKFAKKLLEEADEIEQQQQRILFYYDSIEPLLEKIETSTDYSLSRTDLLTVLEICQVYCDHPDFPQSTEELISSLLSFFLES